VKEISPVDTLGAGDTYLTRVILELLRNGWERIEEEQILSALDRAAEDAAETCEYFGAFGHGLKY
jgi:fructoselysine 6-kinase